MKAVILAGGRGTRLGEETHSCPKPMLKIGNKPILWHIMKTYSAYGINDFIICCGYLGYMIKEYFANYFLHTSDVTFDVKNNSLEIHDNNAEPWRVTLVDTGEETMTGGRLRRIASFLDEDEPFAFTYGDGLIDVNITDLIAFHKEHGKEATVTSVYPAGRFGTLALGQDNAVLKFQEKPRAEGGWINGGYFILTPKVIDRIEGDASTWEQEPMDSLVRDGQLVAFQHTGFWQPMDTLREKILLNELWATSSAPWKVWQ